MILECYICYIVQSKHVDESTKSWKDNHKK